ncbi:MAG: efflux RND transporter permease subunit [Eubacteriales bacterium]
MERIIRFFERYRKTLVVLLVLINVFAIVGVVRIDFSTDFDIFITEGSEYQKNMDEIIESFESDDQVIIMVEYENELNDAIVNDLIKLENQIKDVSNVSSVNGPIPINFSEENITIEALQSYYTKVENLSDKFLPVIQKDNKIFVSFTIILGENFNENDLKEIEEYLEEANMTYYMSGNSYMQKKIVDYILMILLFLPPTALILIMLVFRIQMRSFKATLISLIPAGMGAVWVVGAIGWITNEVSIITVLAPIFTIVIGSADGLHFTSHVQDMLEEGKNHKESLIKTLKMVGVPMVITTVTSIAGFLSLLVMNTNSIKDLAIFGSLGILFAGISTWYVLPLIFIGGIKLKGKKKRKTLKIDLRKIWGGKSFAIAGGLIILAIYGMTLIKTEFNQLMFFKRNTEVQKGFERIVELNGGAIPLFMAIKMEEDPLLPNYANRIMSFQKELEEKDAIIKVVSIYDFYSMFNSFEQGLSELKYPNNIMMLEQLHMMGTESGGSNQLINRQEKVIKLLVFPTDLANNTIDEITNLINEWESEQEDLDVKLAGSQFMMKELNDNMINNQVKSLLLAFVLIFILLFISLKKIRATLLSISPIIVTIILLYGFLGIFGISLNVLTATIFSITLGVGIDYAVHFTSVWINLKKEKMTSQEAVEKAYEYTATPILANAFGLAIGMSALLVSPLKIHQNVSVLMWISMIFAVFLSLSFLPSLLIKDR